MSQETTARPRAAVDLPGIIKRTLLSPTPGSIHRLRTTIRRLEAFLTSAATAEDNKKLLNQVARMRKAAGHVRDVDVHLEILQSLGRRGATTDYADLKNDLKRLRSKRQDKLTSTLEKVLDDGLIRRLKQIGRAEHKHSATPDVSLRRLETEFLGKAVPTPNEAGLHGFRLTCKHLRYSAELEPASRERDRVIAELKKAQDALGAWHDAVTLRSSAEKLLGTTRPIISRLRTLAQSRLNEAHRTIAKSATAVQRIMDGSSSLRTTDQSESNQKIHLLAASA